MRPRGRRRCGPRPGSTTVSSPKRRPYRATSGASTGPSPRRRRTMAPRRRCCRTRRWSLASTPRKSARRGLKGRVLRREVYGEDGDDEDEDEQRKRKGASRAKVPYLVEESNYAVR